MIADVFVDTNVLLYTIDDDPASASKRLRAQHCSYWSSGAGRCRSRPSSSSMPRR
jgi:hypothetical protein